MLGDTLEVASPLKKAVTALRYAWVPYPEPTLNLMDETGLPVAPFETELSFK